VDVIDARVVRRHEPKICGHRRREAHRRAHPHVVGDAFEPIEKLQMKQARDARQGECANCYQPWNELEGLELHAVEISKKSKAAQGCPGFDIKPPKFRRAGLRPSAFRLRRRPGARDEMIPAKIGANRRIYKTSE